LSADCRLTLTVREARDEREEKAAMDLRTRVFCGEQGVGSAEEFDGLDGEATQIVALDETGVVATCRLRFLDDGGDDGGEACKLERMAVEKRLRGLGAGATLLAGSEQMARERGAEKMLLHAQTRAQGFYAANGYSSEGDLFIEADIEHVRMTKPLGADRSGATGE
jgi:predicted GNAT family N-acyltransferase